jgi:excisionase family DNA binding protein
MLGCRAKCLRRGSPQNGIPIQIIGSIISRGEIPFVRLGKKFFLTRESLNRWLETHEERV